MGAFNKNAPDFEDTFFHTSTAFTYRIMADSFGSNPEVQKFQGRPGSSPAGTIQDLVNNGMESRQHISASYEARKYILIPTKNLFLSLAGSSSLISPPPAAWKSGNHNVRSDQ